MRFAILVLCFLPGCFLPQEQSYRPLTDSEAGAVLVTHRAVPVSFECQATERRNLFIWEAPQRRISLYCSGGRRDTGTLACVEPTYENGPFTDGANINMIWDAGWNLHHNLIRHEALHVLLGCLYRDWDRNHRRAEWDTVLPPARDRFLELYPDPPEGEDPYDTLGRPWDLTGTVYEGRDCEVQPHAWIDNGEVPGCPPPTDAGTGG